VGAGDADAGDDGWVLVVADGFECGSGAGSARGPKYRAPNAAAANTNAARPAIIDTASMRTTVFNSRSSHARRSPTRRTTIFDGHPKEARREQLMDTNVVTAAPRSSSPVAWTAAGAAAARASGAPISPAAATTLDAIEVPVRQLFAVARTRGNSVVARAVSWSSSSMSAADTGSTWDVVSVMGEP
jgi:hypothetical protein